MTLAASHATRIVRWIMANQLPPGVDYLNVNFPFDLTNQTTARITTLGLRKYNDQVVKRKDPGGRPYFWQWGSIKKDEEFVEGTDIHTVYVEQVISITPLRLDASVATPPGLAKLIENIS